MMPSPLIIEWQTLKNDYEPLEKNVLPIKLTSLALFLLCLAISSAFVWALLTFFSAGCWKASLKPPNPGLANSCSKLKLPSIKNGNDSKGMQYHTEWKNNRQGGTQLIIEYGKHA